jgi:hypothetical protein
MAFSFVSVDGAPSLFGCESTHAVITIRHVLDRCQISSPDRVNPTINEIDTTPNTT